MSGWIKLHRKVRSWQHYQENAVKAVFIDLLLSVSFEPSWFHGVLIEPGCTPMSISTIQENTGLSRKSVINALKILEESGEITRTLIKNGCITRINNYSAYQGGEIVTPPTTPLATPVSTPSTSPIIRSKELKKTDGDVQARIIGLDKLRDEMLNQGNVERLCMSYRGTPQQVADITTEILTDWEITQEQDTSRKHFLNTFRIKARTAATATRRKTKQEQRMENVAFMAKAFMNTQTHNYNGNTTEQ